MILPSNEIYRIITIPHQQLIILNHNKQAFPHSHILIIYIEIPLQVCSPSKVYIIDYSLLITKKP